MSYTESILGSEVASSKLASESFDRYFSKLLKVFEWLSKNAKKQLTLSLLCFLVAALSLGIEVGSQFLCYLMLGMSVPMVAFSVYQLLVLFALGGLSDVKSELSEIYAAYVAQKGAGLGDVAGKNILAIARDFLRFGLFAQSSGEVVGNLREVIVCMVKLFNPFVLFLFLLSRLVYWLLTAVLCFMCLSFVF